jgi:hypothetical protein
MFVANLHATLLKLCRQFIYCQNHNEMNSWDRFTKLNFAKEKNLGYFFILKLFKKSPKTTNVLLLRATFFRAI